VLLVVSLHQPPGGSNQLEAYQLPPLGDERVKGTNDNELGKNGRDSADG